nr:hypothetical protein [Tanacetum cinerariifolium]
MATLQFVDTHNMVTLLFISTESDGFEQIVDSLNAHPIRYALTVNPTIYISCIEQFWSTTMAKTINEEAQLHTKVDGKKIIVIDLSVRIDLRLADKEGIDCLPNSTIFEQLALMGVFDLEKTKTTQFKEISSLKKRVKKIEKRNRSRTHKLKRLYNFGLIARVESSRDEECLEEHVKPKKKDQIRLDEEPAKKLQAEFNEEERLAREKAEKEERSNIALIEE